MPDVNPGREKVKKYIEDKGISITDLAVAYGVKKQDLASYLNGKLDNPRGNQIILKIISDFRIR
ncbi:helix-turn-helix domain-containing protein [Enterococcus gallinarum]|uniref:helix-turn-helix domain-containing protein n=1 Tax=Enterococcus gallinarum TaxID=1353 RepID=UPI001F562A7F|nr:helix-turn-helix transcriptional regulator [Enterococcus gallinarum]